MSWMEWQRRYFVLTCSDRLGLASLQYYATPQDEWCLRQLLTQPSDVQLSSRAESDTFELSLTTASPHLHSPLRRQHQPHNQATTPRHVRYSFRASSVAERDRWTAAWSIVTALSPPTSQQSLDSTRSGEAEVTRGGSAEAEASGRSPGGQLHSEAESEVAPVHHDGDESVRFHFGAEGRSHARRNLLSAEAAEAEAATVEHWADAEERGEAQVDDLQQLENSPEYQRIIEQAQPSAEELRVLQRIANRMDGTSGSGSSTMLLQQQSQLELVSPSQGEQKEQQQQRGERRLQPLSVELKAARQQLKGQLDPAAQSATSRVAQSAKQQWALHLFFSLSFHHCWWLVIFCINIGLWHTAHSDSFRASQSAAVLSLVQFVLAVLIRNEHFLLAVYSSVAFTFSTLDVIGRWLHLLQRPTRRQRLMLLNIKYVCWSMVHYMGGAHVAFGIAGFAWAIYYWKEEVKPTYEQSDGLNVTLFLAWAMLCCSILSALPPVRFFAHNLFETVHRLSSWSLLLLLTVHISLMYHKRADTLRAVDVFNSSPVWLVLALLFLAAWPWARQQRVTVTIDVPLIATAPEEKGKGGGGAHRGALSPPGHEHLQPGIGMIMTVPDAQAGWWGQAAAGTGNRYSLNCWEFHSFIAVAPHPGLREVQAQYEQFMHEKAADRLQMAQRRLQELRGEGEQRAVSDMAAAEEEVQSASHALACTSTGEAFIADSERRHTFQHLIAVAGDWTGGLVNEAVLRGVMLQDYFGSRIRYRRQVYARRYKAPGYGWTIEACKRAIVVATGGGAAGALPYMFRHLNTAQLRQRRREAVGSGYHKQANSIASQSSEELASTVKSIGAVLQSNAGATPAAVSALKLSRRAGITGVVAEARDQNVADLSNLLDTESTPSTVWLHLIWVCRSPHLNYREMYDALVSLPPSMYTIIDTTHIKSAAVAKFLPALALSAHYHYHTEAISVVSGPQICQAICKEARKQWIPAYQPTFDS